MARCVCVCVGSHFISNSSAWWSLASRGRGHLNEAHRSLLDSREGHPGSPGSVQDSRSSPWPWAPSYAAFVCCSCYLYCGVLFFFFLQGLSSLLIFLPPSTPRDKD